MIALTIVLGAVVPRETLATHYYVRQTVGNDANDGISPSSAWQHIGKLSMAMHAGDTAYVGPGLYREQLTIVHDGTSENRLTFIADTTGQATGDPPGATVITGAELVDEHIFVPDSRPGMYTTTLPHAVLGVVEMDSEQYRYMRIRNREEFPKDFQIKLADNYTIETVAKQPSSFFTDSTGKVLRLHTSDGKPPSTHEMELIMRDSGIAVPGKQHVTIIGFTFRHLGDAGINFQDCAAGVAIDNAVYGSRIGIRVRNCDGVVLSGNSLFRNENSGAYFLQGSINGLVIGNSAYENVKGLRWSSRSTNGIAVGNAVFDNQERGISIEDVESQILRGNRLVDNGLSQVLVVKSSYESRGNCFENRSSEQFTAEVIVPDGMRRRYKSLADYGQGEHEDLGSREGGCGPLPAKANVRMLHAESTVYPERARKVLSGSVESRPKVTRTDEGMEGTRGWVRELFGDGARARDR